MIAHLGVVIDKSFFVVLNRYETLPESSLNPFFSPVVKAMSE
jgi:hypothetical protein